MYERTHLALELKLMTLHISSNLDASLRLSSSSFNLSLFTHRRCCALCPTAITTSSGHYLTNPLAYHFSFSFSQPPTHFRRFIAFREAETRDFPDVCCYFVDDKCRIGVEIGKTWEMLRVSDGKEKDRWR